MARAAAPRTSAGVGKSGSPAPSETTSLPCARRAFVFAMSWSVSEGVSRFTRSLILIGGG
jgi:hypothetical protein